MKNLKKVLALVLAFVMVFGTVAMAGSVYPDVADDAAYAEAVKTLSALGIFKGDNEGNFNPDATITRAEMAKIICTMIGTGELAPTATTFEDVAADHWASGYISYAKGLGYIDGYDEKTFGPEDPVTYEQVVKLVMSVLGYKYAADEAGGYPSGWLYVAADMEVTKAASGKQDQPTPRSTVAIIVNNAMNTPVMERVTYGTEAVWKVLDGTNETTFKSLLTKRDVYAVEGKVLDTYKNNPSILDGKVQITVDSSNTMNGYIQTKLDMTATYDASGNFTGWQSKIFDTICTDAPDFVGYTSKLYFEIIDEEVVLICVNPKTAKNKSIEIPDVEQVYDATKDGSVRDLDKPHAEFDNGTTPAITNYVFSYWNDRDEDSRINTVDIDKNATLYWNEKLGSFAPSISSGDAIATQAAAIVTAMVPARGSMLLVDTDNDGDYDLIKVTEYQIAIVDTINVNANRINFKAEKTLTRGNITLNTTTNKNLKEYSITIDGVAADVKDLQEFDVLNIVSNDYSDPTFVEIEATRKVVEGAVAGKGSDYVLINSEKYEIADTMLALPDLEDEGKFYLDSKGDIAFADVSSVISGNYGYITAAATDNFGDTYVSIFTKDGEVRYAISDKIKINKQYANTADTALTIAQVEAILNVPVANQTTGTAATADATIGDVFGTGSADLTPATFLTNLATATSPAVYVTGSTTTVDHYITGDEVTDKFVTFKIDSNNKLTEVNIATADASENDVFNYVGNEGGAKEWQASIGKFKNGKALPENATIFFVDPAKPVEDYSVKTVADLSDGNNYTPYYFTKTENGPAAVLMIGVQSAVKTDDPFAVFVKAESAKDGYDNVWNVTYYKNGALAEAPLVVDENATIQGEKTAVSAMLPGDTFLYSTNDKGRVDNIDVIFAPGTSYTYTTAFSGFYDVSINSDFAVIDSVTTEDNAVYYGFVGSVKSTNGGVRVSIVDESGSFASEKVVIVPSDAIVTVYNAANSDAKKVSAGDVSDITASSFHKLTNGDMDLTSTDTNGEFLTDPQYMNYAFVRMYKDVVTEVVYVRYFRD